jgi:hypothetical protein
MSESPRSPNYPRKSLPEVISRLKKYKYQLDLDVHNEDEIAQMIGYTGLTGASIPFVSAFKKFGLLEKVNDDSFKFRDDALNLTELTPDRYEEEIFSELVERTAFSPELFAEIRNYYGKSFPNHKELVDLLRRKNFVEKSIPKVVESYESTFNLVASVNKNYQSQSQYSEVNKSVNSQNSENLQPEKDNSSEDGLNYRLTDTISIVVEIHSLPTVDDLRKLTKLREFLEQITN